MEDKFFDDLYDINGYYQCPKGKNGKFLGPLVGYAGEYEPGKKFVGETYVNLAKLDERPMLLGNYANFLCTSVVYELPYHNIDVLCGAPIGGYSLADKLGTSLHKSIIGDNVKVIKAEKRTISLATTNSREKTELFFGRHQIEKGKAYAIVEDVCNNFSTTQELIGLIEGQGGKIVAICCLLNRSLQYDKIYNPSGKSPIPIFSVVRKKIREYRQDDPYVAKEIQKGNVIWKPKDHWPELMKAMGK